jgi:pyridoxine kinase
VGNAETAHAVLEAVRQVRESNQLALYCCDPVMGDVGRGVFVRPEIPELLRTRVVAEADVVTPNLFELELLTGQHIRTLNEAIAAARSLQVMMRRDGSRIVLVTSLLREDAPTNTIENLAVSPDGAWLVQTPFIPLEPPRNGTGDTIAALFFGNHLHSHSVCFSLERAVSALHHLLEVTHQAGTREIQLVAAQDGLINPPKVFSAYPV